MLCFYDLNTCPSNFDFLTFAVIAKSVATQKKQKCHVIFVPKTTTINKKQYSLIEQEFRLNHILVPAAYSLGVSYTVCRTRQEAERIYYSSDDDFWPEDYEIEKPPKGLSRYCSLCHILDQYKKTKLFWPQPTQYALDLVRKELPVLPIVVTMRETSYGIDRNSNIEEWTEFIDYIAPNDPVILIRDTEKWNEVITNLYNYEYVGGFPMASIDLDIRLALYHHAKMSFTVGGGPVVGLLHYSDLPYRTFKFSSDKHGSSSAKFLESMGFPIGSQYPWATENQKILWQDDTFENLKTEYDSLDL